MQGTRVFALAALGMAVPALGAVESYVGQQIVDTQGAAQFDTLEYPDSIYQYQEGGLQVSMDHIAFQWQPLGFDASGVYYPNSGDTEQAIITRVDGGDFEALEFQVGDGWYKEPVYFWGAAFLDGSLQGNFDMDVAKSGSYIGFKGQFDELRVAAYFTPEERNAHNPSGFQAIAMDHMSFGAIPAPGAAGLLGLGALAAARRRR